ncbi:unnamed protein product [Brachionus calyciflorus]|uniref:Uncharacterized protein n=1 Tax=Brachionus calyciflorus TaxID=104777 RepID=A0A813Q6I0_9BILA|nr:unnamed protein product [Brachionus calyciflorus]
MVENCQNQESEKTFFNNLVPLAREIQKLQQTREFIKEFENEKCNFPLKKSEDEEMKISNDRNEIEDDECLKMEVYDDKDYDIEEIKFWNFISKNKGIKPSVIRTIVYKVPESSYIIRKIPIIIDEPDDTKPIENKDKKEIQPDSQSKEIKEEIKKNDILENKIKIKVDPPPTKSEKIKPNLVKSTQKSNEPVKFSSEDIIVIDEDDDIIGFDDDNEDKEDKKETKEELMEENESEGSQMESNSDEDDDNNDADDDIIEEDFIEKQEENLVNDEPDTEINVDQKLDLLQNSIQKRKRGRGTSTNRPKVVIEKANEPASTISVKKSENISKVVKSGSLNKSLPVIAQTKSVNARKSQTFKTEIKKSKDQADTSTNLVSSSSSNASTISSSLLNTSTGNEASRVTRSKAKLIENSK